MLNWDWVFSMPFMALNTVLAITSNGFVVVQSDDKCDLVECLFFAEFTGIQDSAKFNGWCRVDEKGELNWEGVIPFQRVGFEQ